MLLVSSLSSLPETIIFFGKISSPLCFKIMACLPWSMDLTLLHPLLLAPLSTRLILLGYSEIALVAFGSQLLCPSRFFHTPLAPPPPVLWLTLERRLAALTRSHVLQLRRRIQTLRKGSLSITEYLQQIKAISDALAAAGESLNESDLVAHILHGLPPEYEAFTTSIRVRAEPVTSDELHGLLLSQEVELEVQSASHDLAQPLPPAQAFDVSSSNRPRFPPRGPNHNFRPNTFPRPRFPNPSAQFRTAFPNSNPPLLPNPSYPLSPSLQHNSNPNRPRPRCQICGLANHRALDCFNGWNHAYQGRVPPARLAAMAAPTRRAMPTANFTPTSSATPFNHSAPSDSLWYIDSGATNHITSDLSNLNLSDPYNGPDQVSVASGQGSSVGEGTVSQPY